MHCIFLLVAAAKHEVKPIAALGFLIKNKLRETIGQLTVRSSILLDTRKSTKEFLDSLKVSHTEELTFLHHKRDEQVDRLDMVYNTRKTYMHRSLSFYIVLFGASSDKRKV